MTNTALRSLLDPWRPETFRYRRFLLTLAIAITGGIAFSAIRWPLAWMIGPMVFCAIAALSRVPVSGPTVIRPPALVLVGLALGASFTPALIGSIPGYVLSIAVLFCLLIVSVSACYVYFRVVGQMSPATALFAAMPGGLNEMVLLSEQHNADTRAVALVQTSRIAFVIALIPILIRFDRPFDMSVATTAVHAAWTGADIAMMVACGCIGIIAGHLARLPAPYLFGPLIVSAIAHGLGWTSVTLPSELTNGAQVLLGLVLGCRFVGMAFRAVARLLVVSMGAAAILVALAWTVAWTASNYVPADFVSLLLAYAPGGVAEMSLAALALHTDPAIVALHHVVRIGAILVCIRPIVTVLKRRWANTT